MSDAHIEIILNGQRVQTQAVTLGGLVEDQSLAAAKVATAVNGQFVAAVQRATTLLQPGDRVEIVSPRQGG